MLHAIYIPRSCAIVFEVGDAWRGRVDGGAWMGVCMGVLWGEMGSGWSEEARALRYARNEDVRKRGCYATPPRCRSSVAGLFSLAVPNGRAHMAAVAIPNSKPPTKSGNPIHPAPFFIPSLKRPANAGGASTMLRVCTRLMAVYSRPTSSGVTNPADRLRTRATAPDPSVCTIKPRTKSEIVGARPSMKSPVVTSTALTRKSSTSLEKASWCFLLRSHFEAEGRSMRRDIMPMMARREVR